MMPSLSTIVRTTRRDLLIGAAAAVLAPWPLAAQVGETGLSPTFMDLQQRLTAALPVRAASWQAYTAAQSAIERAAAELGSDAYFEFWAQHHRPDLLDAAISASDAVEETLIAIFTRTPANRGDEHAIMDAIAIFEAELFGPAVLRAAPRAFFTPARFCRPETERHLAAERAHYLDPDNEFEKFHELPDYLSRLRRQAAQQRV